MEDLEEEKMEVVETPNPPARGRKRKSSLEIDPEKDSESATKRRPRSSRKSSSNLEVPEKEELSAKRPRKRQKPSTDVDIVKNSDLTDDAMDFEDLSHFSGLEQETESERMSTRASITSRESSRHIKTTPVEESSQRRRSNRVKTPIKMPEKVPEEEEEEIDDDFEVRSTSSTISTRSATSHRSLYSTLSRPLMPPLATYNPTLHGRRSLTTQPNLYRAPTLPAMRTVSEPTKVLVNQSVQPTLEKSKESQPEPSTSIAPINENPPTVENVHQVRVNHAPDENEENVLSSRSNSQGTILVAMIILLFGALPFILKDYGSRMVKNDSSILFSPDNLSPTVSSSSLEEIISEFEFRSNTTLEQMNQELESMINFLKPQYEELSNKSSNYLNFFVNETNIKETSTTITVATTPSSPEEIYTIIGVDGSSLNVEKEIARLIEETEEMEKEILIIIEEEKKNVNDVATFPSIPTNTLLTAFSEKIEQIEEELDKTIHLLEDDQKNINHFQQTLQENLENIENNLKNLHEELQMNILISSDENEELLSSSIDDELVLIDVAKVQIDEENVVAIQQEIIEAFHQTQSRISNLNEEYDLMKYSDKKVATMVDGSNEIDRFLVEQNSLDPNAVLSLSDTTAIESFVEEVTALAIVEAIETAEANADKKYEIQATSDDNNSSQTIIEETADASTTSQSKEDEKVANDEDHDQLHHDNSFYLDKISQFGPDLAHSPRGGRIIAPNGRDTSFHYKNRIPVGFVANLLPKNNLSDYHILNEYHRPNHGHCYAVSPRRAVVSMKLVKPMLINAIGVTFVLPPSTSEGNESALNQLIDERTSLKEFELTAWEKHPSSGFPAAQIGRFEFLFPNSAKRYLDMNESHYFRQGHYEGHFIERKVDQITNYYDISALTSSLGPMQKFRFEILSNYGNSNLTCIYRLHVYGPDV